MRNTVAGHWKLTTTSWEDPEKAMATHSSTLSWRIPGMAEPGGLPSMGLHRVGHDWSDLAAAGERIIEADLLPLYKKLAKNSTSTILNQLFGIWSKLERWKGSIKWVPHELTQNQKTRHFEVLSSLIPRNNIEPLLKGIVMCDKKWILYDNGWWPAQCLDWEAAPQDFPKPNLHQKRGHGHCLVVCCLSDPLKLSESQWNHHIWEIRSANRDAPKTAPPAAGIGQQQRSSSSQHATRSRLQKLNKSGPKFCLIRQTHLTSCQSTTTSSSISTFCRENASITRRTQKMLSKSSSNPEAWIFML